MHVHYVMTSAMFTDDKYIYKVVATPMIKTNGTVSLILILYYIA